jgi:chromate transporter
MVHGDVSWVSAIFGGLAWGVVGIVGAALVRIGTRALTIRLGAGIAISAFLSLFVFGVPFPVVILAAGLAGHSLI